MSRTFLLWAVLGLMIPFALGGWTGLLWGGLVRVFLTHHVTWSVNSVCHTFGKREAKEVYRVPPALLARRSTGQRRTGPLVPELVEESA